MKPPKWIKVLIYISIIWAFSIHTVTGFLYAGIPGRHYWLTAIMAARFLASAFCSGPAILLLLLMAVRRVTGFEPGREAMKTLSTIITYAMCVNVFFYLLEIFTAFYSHDGSVVYVNHDPLRAGDVGIFCVDGDMLCKQYYRDPLGVVYLFSLNRRRADADVILPPSSGRSLTCFGRVMLHGLPIPE